MLNDFWTFWNEFWSDFKILWVEIKIINVFAMIDWIENATSWKRYDINWFFVMSKTELKTMN